MSVTVMLSGTETSDEIAVLQALSVARRLKTPLNGLCALPDPASALLYTTSPYMIGIGGAAMDSVNKAQEDVINAARQMFERLAEASGEGVECRFEHRVGQTDREAGDAACLADAIVFPRDAGNPAHALGRAFEHVMMDTRLPVLLAGNATSEAGPALIAWDGSPQAARAVRLNEGLIRMAGDALIAQNPDDLGERRDRKSADADALKTWLEARGVHAASAEFSGDIADGLISLAGEHGAQMIIAGAYGHSRAGEFLFGGATRGLLHAKAAPPLALVH